MPVRCTNHLRISDAPSKTSRPGPIGRWQTGKARELPGFVTSPERLSGPVAELMENTVRASNRRVRSNAAPQS